MADPLVVERSLEKESCQRAVVTRLKLEGLWRREEVNGVHTMRHTHTHLHVPTLCDLFSVSFSDCF